MARKIDFADGAQSSTTPTIGNIVASNLTRYASDAAYEAAESGAPVGGNIYYNTTTDQIRMYDEGEAAWKDIVEADVTAASVTYDNAASGLTATDVQAAIDEVEGRLDTAEAAIPVDTDDLSEGSTNLYYTEGRVDANSSVVANTAKVSFPEAPNDGTQYTRKNLGWEAVAAGANQQLSNLSAVAVNTAINPGVDNTYTLGSASKNWQIVNARIFSGNIGTTEFVSEFNSGNAVWLHSGHSNTAAATGDATFQAGDALVVGSGTVGTTYLRGGSIADASNANNAGDVEIRPGTTIGAGNRGKLLIADGSEGTSGHVWTSIDTSGTGGWAAPASGSDLNVVSKVAGYTALTTDDVILCSGGVFTIDLYTAVGNTGKTLTIKKTDASLTNIITIDGSGSETIGGSTTRTLNTENESYEIVSDGSNWIVLNHETETKAADYTPGTNGPITAPTFHVAQWWREGASCHIMIRMVTTDRSAVELQVDLPGAITCLTGDATNTTKLGHAVALGASAVDINVLATDGDNFLNFSDSNSLTPATATALLQTNTTLSYAIVVPIKEWDA